MTGGVKQLSETDSVEVRVEVEKLAGFKLAEVGDAATKVDVFYEHGRWWVKLWNLPPERGAQDDEEVFAVVDVAGTGLELEEL